MSNVAQKVYSLVKDTVHSQGVTLWDVRFLKEGAEYYLRIFIDKDGGADIDDCTAVSHAVDPIIDAADPISQSYYLEVCSAGIDRELILPHHFDYAVGKTVKASLYGAKDGIKEVEGTLVSHDGESITVNDGEKETVLNKTDIAKINTVDNLEGDQ
ncbi:MAG: ribosome maturation factor RimP [Oscillospiraceae bacterium]|nr:ribosome maturation factor RimP [Candidatus Equicaccousia limihippi]